MFEYQVRRVEATDSERLRAIRLRSLADAPDAFGTTLAEDEARSDAEWRARAEDDAVAQFLAVSSDGDCIGLAVGASYSDYPDSAGLFGMWVAPEVRGWKVGSTLVEAIVAWARSENYQQIVLDVGDANAAAIRLYESCGFVSTGKTSTLPVPREHIAEHERVLRLQ